MASNTVKAVELPMAIDVLIKVGMLADIEGHGDGLPIERIAVALCPRRDPAAEGAGEFVEGIEGDPPTAVEVGQIEAALLPYAVFDFGSSWAYGRQVRRVYEAGQ